jgi:membrane-associated phospholipid phosphatase
MGKTGFGFYIAKTVSYLLHPLLIPTLGLWLIFRTHSYLSFVVSPDAQKALFIVVFTATFVFPVLSAILLLSLGRIRSLEMESPEERKMLYLLTAVYYVLGYYLLLSKMQLPQQINLLLLGANAAIVLTLLINLFWKVSAHAIGIGGLTGALLGFSHQLEVNVLPELILVLFLAGITGYGRLRLNAHSPSQVYAGFLVGFLCEFLLFLV